MSLTTKITDNLILDVAKTSPSTAKQIAVAMMDSRACAAVVRSRKINGLDAGLVTMVVKQDSDRQAYFAWSPSLNKLVPVDPTKFQPLMP